MAPAATFDTPRERLAEWLRGELGGRVASPEPCAIEALDGDVSPRRYYRVRSGRGSWIAALYPADHLPAFDRYLATSSLLGEAGVRVARIERHDRERGFMLLEDLGTLNLYESSHGNWRQLEPLFNDALRQLALLRRLDRRACAALNPPLDDALLRAELHKTWTLFIEPYAGADRAFADELRVSLEALSQRLAGAAMVPCHRDFMARNLMPLAQQRVAILDHQDLRLGPAGYDIASLLNDSLFAPPGVERRLCGGPPADEVSREDYLRCVVQRTLKAIGTFVSFAQKGFPRHLKLVPPCSARAARALAELPEGESLKGELRDAFERASATLLERHAAGAGWIA
jgi:aminoglycoside/choline kinase family phosphotransferase